MYETNYHRPASVEDAVRLFSGAEDAKFLSGGQTLLPTMKQRLAAPSDVIDLTHIPAMQGITVEGDTISIGAATSHADVANSADIVAKLPALAELASHIGDPHVRNMGTLGGSVANNDPAADYPAAVLALNATVHTNTRTITAEAFFTGLFETSLEEGEIITHISFKVPQNAAYAKFPNPASRYAMAGVFVAKYGDGSVRVAVTGAGSDGAYRHEGMEAALSGNWSGDAIAGTSVDESAMLSDIHGSAAYRANLVKVMAKRAVEAAS
ncbi:MAG: carbon monoxide dehydrogenase [Hyphomicrobiales bacterium]|nr:xanthine dehydrogenase family protein subunit M [Hyphomicrobiales bacterium]PCJ84997.1 MAG: carbon monoxide dehydrogenase [Hyphomicrobiales bacterium]